MKDAIIRFLKDQYDDFVPVWNWTTQPVKGKRRQDQRLYNQILSTCRYAQYFVAAIALVFALSFDDSRKLFYSAALRDGVLLVLMELSSFIFLGYFMGLKRLPANYISLVIIKSFVVLERSYRPEVADFELKVLENSRNHGQMSLLSYKPNPKLAVGPVEAHAKNLWLMVCMIAAVWALSKFTKIDVTGYDKCVLITTTLSTSIAAMLLVTTFAFKEVPEIKPAHKRWCEMWVIFSVSTLVFVLVFLLQRVRLLLARKGKPSHNLRMQWECVLFMLSLYIMCRYVPVIHKGLSIRNILKYKTIYLIRFLIPETLLELFKLAGIQTFAVGERWARILGESLKY